MTATSKFSNFGLPVDSFRLCYCSASGLSFDNHCRFPRVSPPCTYCNTSSFCQYRGRCQHVLYVCRFPSRIENSVYNYQWHCKQDWAMDAALWDRNCYCNDEPMTRFWRKHRTRFGGKQTLSLVRTLLLVRVCNATRVSWTLLVGTTALHACAILLRYWLLES